MNWGNGNRRLLWLLGASLLFNLAFAASYMVGMAGHWAGESSDPDEVPVTLASLQRELADVPEVWQGIEASRKKLGSDLAGIRKQLRSHREDLAGLMASDAPDRAAIGDKVNAIARLRSEMQRTMIDAILDMRAGVPQDKRRVFDQVIHRDACPRLLTGKPCPGKCGQGKKGCCKNKGNLGNQP